jgi:hypothetical protein
MDGQAQPAQYVFKVRRTDLCRSAGSLGMFCQAIIHMLLCAVIPVYFPNTVLSRSVVRAAGLVRIFFSS